MSPWWQLKMICVVSWFGKWWMASNSVRCWSFIWFLSEHLLQKCVLQMNSTFFN